MRREMLGQVLSNQSRFGEDDRLGTWRLDSHHRRLSKRVDLLQFRIGALLVALVYFDLIVDFAFFEKPDNALGARQLQPVVGSIR